MSHFKIKTLPLAMSLAVPALCLLCNSAMAADVKTLALPAVTVSDSRLDNTAPGATKLDKASLPAIHGLADDRLRIKWDGMDLMASCPNHMNPALSYLDPSNVGRAQGLRGHHAGQRRR